VIPDELCSSWASHSQAVKDAALWLASTYLWARTGRQYGPCPVTVRPAQDRFEDPAYRAYPMWPGQDPVVAGPYLFGGVWRNCGCGPRCCCRPECAVVLRGPVASVNEVMVDGEVVPSSAYRVDVTQGTYWLIRLDGTCWPTCQDFTAAPDAAGAFQVIYERGRELPEALAVATAILACEYGKGMTGGDCRLPARMTSLNRQGVTVEVEPASPEEGLTGITEVDAIVAALNPSKRTRPPVLLSPDLPESCDRMTVIPAGSS
jgi:hypothetical protein